LVVEAHAVLSDPHRRERYDLGEDEDGTADSSQMRGGMPPDLAAMFAQFGSSQGSGFSFNAGGPRGFHGF
jgi:DnaJ family protein C protein 7